MTTNAKTRTITLTDQPPVKIREDEWPIIAHGSYEMHDGQHRVGADRTTDIDIRVRRHADGRAIVYGVYRAETRVPGERDEVRRAGLLREPYNDLPTAIRAVGLRLIDMIREPTNQHDGPRVRAAMADCIADLPAELV